MKKINFKELEIYTDVTKANKIKGDARQEFANVLYMGCNGIAAHALALKIYQSDGELEISEPEEQLIRQVAHEKCTPVFIDGISEQLNRE